MTVWPLLLVPKGPSVISLDSTNTNNDFRQYKQQIVLKQKEYLSQNRKYVLGITEPRFLKFALF